MKRLKLFLKGLANEKFWGYGLFWSWNLIFLTFMTLGFAPMLLPEMVRSTREGLTPPSYLIYVLLLTSIPLIASLLGLMRLRHHPRRLLGLGYGVEGPLMILLLVRAFVVRDGTAAINWITIVAVTGIAIYLWQLLDFKVDERHVALQYVRGVGLALVMLLGLYVVLFILFYAVPIVVQTPFLLGEMGRLLWDILSHPDWYNLTMIPFALMGSILIVYTGTLLVGMPVAMPVLYVRAWLSGGRALASRHGWLPTAGLTAGVSALCIGVLIATNQQLQTQAYTLLKDPPTSVAQAKTLMKEETVLRSGLLNAYLAPLRYISAVGEVGHIRELYQWSLKLTEAQADGVEALYALLARPLLYEPMKPEKAEYEMAWMQTHQGALNYDSTTAAKLYEAYFDQPIVDGEHDTLVRAAQSTWSSEQALASLRIVEEHEVHLLRQEVTLAEHGDWAEVELYEMYQNDTSARQEVVYYFNLPETAVLTGLWLNTSPDRDTRFAYQVAPRGAAQQVYQEQKRINKDPALLEQIGPRQYRLRIFPVEASLASQLGSATQPDVRPLYMWMTFSVLAENGAWPMPSLAEHYNVYWDRQTERLVNGQPMQNNGDHWLPAQIPASSPVTPLSHRVDFPSGETVILRPAEAASLPQLPAGVQLGVVLDRSRSMAAQAYPVRSALSEIQRISPDAEICLTAPSYLGETPAHMRLDALAVADLFYAGGQKASDLLGQYFQQCSGNRYDALLVLTDSGNFTLDKAANPVPVLHAPVWVVHLDGKFPLGYDDATLQVIQASGGGVASSLDDALTRLAVELQAQDTTSSGAIADVLDGYEVITYLASVDAPADTDTLEHSLDDPFTALAARRLVLATMYQQRGQINELATLDHLHAIAQTYSIVTPYSSLLVLVNERQQQRLEDLEGQADRFQREGEATTPDSAFNSFQVTGVPEPHEWLLLTVGALLLGGYLLRRRSAGV